MPRLISFSMTTDQVRRRTKRVTRRLGWKNARVGEELRAVRKVMGRKKGEPIVDLARIIVMEVTREPLYHVTDDDVTREGYPGLTASQFIAKFCAGEEESQMTMQVQISNLDATRTAKVKVIDFDIESHREKEVDWLTLGPGEARSVYIHAARKFVVTEDPLASQPGAR